MRSSTPAYERIMQRTTRTASGCLEYTGARNRQSYGTIWELGFKSPQKAHRVVWRHHNGTIPQGMSILHRCDNPPCVEISHLFLGTVADNNRDMANKGRQWQQRKTHCKHGHAFADHGRVVMERTGPHRICMECRREWNRRRPSKRATQR